MARSALLIVFVAGALLSASTLSSWRTLERERRDALDVQIMAQVDLARMLIEKEYFEIAGDLAVTARAPAVVRFAETRSPSALRSAQALVAEVVASYGRYPHARLLDPDGRELLRIDRFGGGATIASVDTTPLTFHARLAREALALPVGTLSVSGLGSSEEEDSGVLLPTVHFLVPVVDATDRPLAVLVLDYDASGLLDEVAGVFATSLAEDVWLGPAGDVFRLPRDGTSLSDAALYGQSGPLASVAPRVAAGLADAGEGPVEGPDGRLFVTRTDVLPPAPGASLPSSWASGPLAASPASAPDAEWTLAARVAPATLADLRPRNDPATRVQAALVALVVTLLSVVAASAFEALRGARRRAEQDALTDAPTGAGNRRAFQADLARDVARAARSRQPLALVVLDLDRFKSINDRYGHAGGDAVLATFVATAQRTLRAGDAVYRIGGEEFALLLPGADQAAVVQSVERLRTTIAAHPAPWQGERIAYTASFGVVAAPPETLQGDPATMAEDLLRRADQATYAAKRAGRERVEVAETPAVPRST